MRISVITPTCDRPVGIKLLEKYMAAQTIQPDEWIVADGGKTPASLTRGQTHLHAPFTPGARNLMNNVLRGLRTVTGDVVFVFEDDDIYFPDHIEKSLKHLESTPATGGDGLKYFNVRERCWIEMKNKGSALCQTSFRRELLPVMEAAAKKCFHDNSFGLDCLFWKEVGLPAAQMSTVVGMKGLPGTPGLGMGHRPNPIRRGWKFDPTFSKLAEWVGQERAAPYTSMYEYR